MTIWKYPLAVTDTQSVSMPKGAKILTVQIQRGEACLWALVEPDNPTETRIIEIFGTGHPIPDGAAKREHIGTFQLPELGLVFHVFERK